MTRLGLEMGALDTVGAVEGKYKLGISMAEDHGSVSVVNIPA